MATYKEKGRVYRKCLSEQRKRRGFTTFKDTAYCSCLSGNMPNIFCEMNGIDMSKPYPPPTTTTTTTTTTTSTTAAPEPEDPMEWVSSSLEVLVGLAAVCSFLCLLCWCCCRNSTEDTSAGSEDGEEADGRTGTTTERIPYSRYGYRPPETRAAPASTQRVPYSRYGYRPPDSSHPTSAASPVPSAPPQPENKPETPLEAPPPYEALTPLGPPSYEAVCREMAGELSDTRPGSDCK
ncbi:formin-like protein 3 [Amphibalanus amphitrite]|uniref:formin-like protein 3 n=1 Tax=Amphibalanus amphitrite TaxID=1232801 RepID=UPI001C903D74|nr:formin-like protein 3 [Amphibalanus amphitrite]XP_043226226.1 formin-like protein 3 [Amphibalanus amphitrite]